MVLVKVVLDCSQWLLLFYFKETSLSSTPGDTGTIAHCMFISATTFILHILLKGFVN